MLQPTFPSLSPSSLPDLIHDTFLHCARNTVTKSLLLAQFSKLQQSLFAFCAWKKSPKLGPPQKMNLKGEDCKSRLQSYHCQPWCQIPKAYEMKIFL